MSPSRSAHFAHLTDIHVSDAGDSWGALGGQAPQILKDTLTQLNAIDDLDFVLVTGDAIDLATYPEIERFLDAMQSSQKPWYFVPGNHDGFVDPYHPDALTPAQVMAAIDPTLPEHKAQHARISQQIRPGLQLIGLDSRKTNDWGGIIGARQWAWFEQELADHANNMIILAVHHPLHKLGPHNDREWFDKFICENGEQMLELLDREPNVKLVLSGHHHAQHLAQIGDRIHINTASLTGYPCVYRLIRMTETQDGGWHVAIQTHTSVDDEIVNHARDQLYHSDMSEKFNASDREAWLRLCEGAPADQTLDIYI